MNIAMPYLLYLYDTYFLSACDINNYIHVALVSLFSYYINIVHAKANKGIMYNSIIKKRSKAKANI